jgi:bla regulator protein BlaR1
MLAMPAAFFITLFAVMPESLHRFPPAASLPLLPAATAAAAAPRAASIPDQLANSMRWLVPFWFAGMVLFSLRGVLGWVASRRLRSSPCIGSTTSVWQSRLTALANQLGIAQAVVLVESRLVDVPMVAGFLRPVILLPAGLLTGLPAEQIE